MTLLTAKQIAEKIAASAEDVPSSMERVRHWTRERLLIPVGEANPGTGRRRLYNEEALSAAIILNALADFGIGIGLTGKNYFDAAFTLAKDAAKTIKPRKKEGFVCFLSINKGAQLGNPLVMSTEIPEMKLVSGEALAPIHPSADSAIVLNLTKLLA